MSRPLLLVVLAGALALGAVRPEMSAQPSPAAASPPATLALLESPSGVTLARLDSSLRALPGRRLAVGPYLRGWSFSRDGSRLALGTDETARLAFVDARRLRILGRVELARAGAVAATAWLGPRLLLAIVVGSEGAPEVLSVDPVARRVLSRRELDGSLLRHVRTVDGFALLLAPAGAIGAPRLAVVRASGAVDVVALDRVRAGSVSGSERDPFRIELPGLAVDPDGRRAYVVPSGAELAEVDLDGLGVRYHQLSEPVSLLGRLGAWLEPEAHAKSGNGPVRSTRWLGDGVLAVVVAGGFLIGKSTADGEAPPAPKQGAMVSAGDLTVRAPSGWRQSQRSTPVPGLKQEKSIVPAGEELASITIGTSNARPPTLLPRGLAASPGKPQGVKLGELEALRYDEIERASDSVRVYAAPVSGGTVATVACLLKPDATQSEVDACDQTAATLELTAGDPGTLDMGYSRTLDRAIGQLNATTEKQARALAKAKTSSAQAAAATALAAAYRKAAGKLRHATADPALADRNAKLLTALDGLAKDYGRLAQAARDEDSSAYTRARREIESGEAELEKALG